MGTISHSVESLMGYKSWWSGLWPKPSERHKSLGWEKRAKQAIPKIPVTVEDSVSPVVFNLHCPLKSFGELLKNPDAQASHKAS